MSASLQTCLNSLNIYKKIDMKTSLVVISLSFAFYHTVAKVL